MRRSTRDSLWLLRCFEVDDEESELDAESMDDESRSVTSSSGKGSLVAESEAADDNAEADDSSANDWLPSEADPDSSPTTTDGTVDDDELPLLSAIGDDELPLLSVLDENALPLLLVFDDNAKEPAWLLESARFVVRIAAAELVRLEKAALPFSLRSEDLRAPLKTQVRNRRGNVGRCKRRPERRARHFGQGVLGPVQNGLRFLQNAVRGGLRACEWTSKLQKCGQMRIGGLTYSHRFLFLQQLCRSWGRARVAVINGVLKRDRWRIQP